MKQNRIPFCGLPQTQEEGAVHIVYTTKMFLENLSPIRRNNFAVSTQRLLDALPLIFSITGLKV